MCLCMCVKMSVSLVLTQEDKPSGSRQLHLDTLQCAKNGASRSWGYVFLSSIGTFNLCLKSGLCILLVPLFLSFPLSHPLSPLSTPFSSSASSLPPFFLLSPLPSLHSLLCRCGPRQTGEFSRASLLLAPLLSRHPPHPLSLPLHGQ